ncbi:hypothetical protein [Azospirillum doebereinerae]|uniref:SCP2 domain-containing protein n=1 Tax=Azospirillum doebereinerae TaxID=92933 RepID=A0A3S0VFX4_9PROT|nr:hypothetical protein [Azospirillum doebereinerae]MCG5238325.1 hypothetical protein [Azospirillum doebereinerae]RUQ66792.1 hypothetical protein EJ913_21640 [Azospirillum doebereinerae]
MTAPADTAAPAPFTGDFLPRLAGAVAQDAYFRDRCTAAHLTFGLRDTGSGASGWLRVDGPAVSAAAGPSDSRFTIEGDGAAWRDLLAGLPVNRLLRQHRMTVSGDIRSCVQNWLLVFAVTSAAQRLAAQDRSEEV